MAGQLSDLLAGTMQSGYLGESAAEGEGPSLAAADRDLFAEHSLAELSEANLAFFTHGPLFTLGGLDFAAADPVAEYVGPRDLGDRVGFHDFAAPLFAGIAARYDDEAWDRRLFFCDKALWADLRGWILAAVPCDRATRRYHRVVAQAVRVMDPVGILRFGAAAPGVAVTCFGLCGTHADCEFAAPPLYRSGIVRVVPARRTPSRRTQRAQVLREAEAYFGLHPDPILSS